MLQILLHFGAFQDFVDMAGLVEGAVMLDEFRPRPGQKYALVFGNEVDGVAQEVVDAADGAIEIPQAGTKHSVNVSVAGGVVLWNFFWQIRPKR